MGRAFSIILCQHVISYFYIYEKSHEWIFYMTCRLQQDKAKGKWTSTQKNVFMDCYLNMVISVITACRYSIVQTQYSTVQYRHCILLELIRKALCTFISVLISYEGFLFENRE